MLDRPVDARGPLPERTERGERSPERRAPSRSHAAQQMPIEPEGLTVASLLGALRRRRWVLVACVLLFPLIAFVAAKQLTPRYTANTTVMFEPTEYAARELQSILRDESTTDAVLASQVEVVRSLNVARRIVRRFGLTEREEFAWWLQDQKRADTLVYRLRSNLAELLYPVSEDLADAVAPRPPARIPPPEIAEIQAAESSGSSEVNWICSTRELRTTWTASLPCTVSAAWISAISGGGIRAGGRGATASARSSDTG
jgi:hypothetical protein